MKWRRREVPLAPLALVAAGEAAEKLSPRAGAFASLKGEDVLLLVGDELPWADGVVYLGRDPAAPRLLLPTALAPEVPVDLLERALLEKFADAVPPLAVWGERVMPAGHARKP